jgi:hypothetical protein
MSDAEPKAEHGVPIEYVLPETLIALFSDAVFVTHTDAEFYIDFYQTQVPLMVPGMTPPEKVTSRCVARIVLTPKHAARLSEVFQKNINKFGARLQALVEEQGREPNGDSA